ncbi:hypothetical protein B0H16DRAFT_1887702 [Mycena metata]|uniref:Uncharacterized protein n=1 Tax=Mycena metata TaxID=1033252 RepID=A0AAD7IUM5_9AGAR|nr:hypothetical protein B0H16DRAFT_1887702 [Mycena metata]
MCYTRNTPTGTNAQFPSSRPTSVAIPGDTPQASRTKTAATTQATDPAHAVSTAAPSAFLQPVGAVTSARIPGFYGPPPPSATANRDTINLVSPEGSAIDLVSPTAPEAELEDASESNHDNRGAVRSPLITSVPLASLVARVADAFDAGADISTATAALTIDTTNLPAPTDTAMSPPLPPPGVRQKTKPPRTTRRTLHAIGRSHSVSAKASPPRTPPSAFLSPLDITARTIAHTGTLLADENLSGFFDEHVRPEPHFLADMEHAIAAEENLGPNALFHAPEQEQRDFEHACQASLGVAPPVADGASSSRRPEGPGSGSPPKKTRTDTLIRVTRASSAAAAQAAATAVAAATAPLVAIVNPRPAAAAAAPPAPREGTVPPAGAAPAPESVLAPALQHPQPAVPVVNPRMYDGQALRVFVTQGPFPETTANPVARLRNVDTSQVPTWHNTPGTILTDGADLISGSTNVPRELIRMGAANAANPRLPAPNVFGITGIPPDIAALLLSDRVLSIKQVTLFLYSLVPDESSGFLGNIEGLTFPNTPAGAQEAANMITQTLSTTPAFIQLVMNHRDNLPGHWSIEQALTAILGSIAVSPIELLSPRGPRVIWRVYMMVTTRDATAYTAIRAAFAPILFVTAFNNTGVRGDMFCRICESIDHPTLLCPFPTRAADADVEMAVAGLVGAGVVVEAVEINYSPGLFPDKSLYAYRLVVL